MGIENFLNYEHYIELQNRQLKIWGQPCTIFIPENIVDFGYENTLKSETDIMDVDSVLSNKYSMYPSKIWINFTITKNVFYKFNWFPDDADELCMAFMDSSSNVRENSYIRTSLNGASSIWGDTIFEVVKIQDVGLAQVLQRIYFLRPTSNNELYKVLGTGNVGTITGTVDSTNIKIDDATESEVSSDYNSLFNKPTINGVVLQDNQTTQSLNIDTNDKYSDDGSGISIGGISQGDTFDNENITDVVRQMLHPYEKPSVEVTFTPSEVLRLPDDSFDSITFNVKYTKGTNVIKSCKVLVNNSVVYTENKSDGGQFAFTYHNPQAFSSDVNLKVVVTDNVEESVWTDKIMIITNSYYGVVADSVTIDADTISRLNKVLKDSNNFTYPNINIDYGRIVYAYPSRLGELAYIFDGKTDWNITSNFSRIYIDIDGVEYVVYYLTDSAGYSSTRIIFRG